MADIHVIAVDPEQQGRGAGIRLVKYGVEMAERTKLPIYFEASPTTVGLYERAGMRRLKEQVTHKAEDLGTEEDITVPLMVYTPVSGKSLLPESMFVRRQTLLAKIFQWLVIMWWSITNYS
jgi:predicted N-acetyltransferase YhbS